MPPGEFRLPITVFTGPATDNEVGRHYIQAELLRPAFNAMREAAALVATAAEAVEDWKARHTGAAA